MPHNRTVFADMQRGDTIEATRLCAAHTRQAASFALGSGTPTEIDFIVTRPPGNSSTFEEMRLYCNGGSIAGVGKWVITGYLQPGLQGPLHEVHFENDRPFKISPVIPIG